LKNEKEGFWLKEEIERYTKLNESFMTPKPLAEGRKGMIAGTFGALAVHAGLKALKQGGSAADAAMVTALTQIVLSAGSMINYAGILNMVYYDASTGMVHSMNASYNTVQEEKDPMSIPFLGTPSGRSALVPGFMAGVQAAHDRFGKLPLAALFEPAIYFAEEGFFLDVGTLMWIDPFNTREKVLARLPDTKKIFTKENGEFLGEGDLFRQPQLADTLRRVASQGAEYMYKGDWAKKFVEVVQRDGGKLTLKDLLDYEVIWSEALKSTYREYEVFNMNLPNIGGLHTIEALNLLECADIRKFGHYKASPEALFWFMQISRAPWYFSNIFGTLRIDQELFKKYFPGLNFSLESRVKKETAKLLWERLKEMGGWSQLNKEALKMKKRKSGHTAAVVAVDELGNVAAVIHTNNTAGWGATGIFVDGVSIPDSASFQQQEIKDVGPGNRLPEDLNPLIVIKEGKPLLASGATGMGLHEITLQNVVNVLDFGMDPKTSIDAPKFGVPVLSQEDMTTSLENIYSRSEYHKQFIRKVFPKEILDAVQAMGQELKIIPKPSRISETHEGYGRWVGIHIDPKDRKLRGGTDPWLNGLAEGY